MLSDFLVLYIRWKIQIVVSSLGVRPINRRFTKATASTTERKKCLIAEPRNVQILELGSFHVSYF